MVSFHKVLAETPIAEVVPPSEFEAPPRKRKWGEETLLTEEFFKHDPTDHEKRKSIFGIELHLETPLPSHKLQQYLTIQSGQIHLCNTGMSMMRTQDSERNHSDPKAAPSLGQMSLDLELSLKKKEDSYDSTNDQKKKIKNYGSTGSTFGERDLLIESNKLKKDDDSWLSSEGDHREMIATVCMKCHMLVMLCKSSPACPNCKFMHPPPDQNPSKFLKRKKVQPLLC